MLKALISKFNTLVLKSLLKMVIIFGLFPLIHTLMENIALYMTQPTCNSFYSVLN
jgi:hypothetical protein